MPKFTPIQSRMMKVLANGKPHHRKELWACLEDPLANISNIKAHIAFLRKKLRPLGKEIVCEIRGKDTYYRIARTIGRPS